VEEDRDAAVETSDLLEKSLQELDCVTISCRNPRIRRPSNVCNVTSIILGSLMVEKNGEMICSECDTDEGGTSPFFSYQVAV
jgi:hypothetical protein